MTRSITKAAADKLGERLRKSEVISEEDLYLLQEFRRDYEGPLAYVQQVLRKALDLDPTSRIKTPNTIYEKLRRDRTRLSTMQDIAGVRVVREMTLNEQDLIVKQICSRFPENRVDDRRLNPSHGYRAVHVIASIDGFPVEIQVRTPGQHLWAELFEKLADDWGRQIRYGESLVAPEGSSAESIRREAAVRTILTASKALAVAEKNRADVQAMLEAEFLSAQGRHRGMMGLRGIKAVRKRRQVERFKGEAEEVEMELRLIFEDILKGFKQE